MINISELIQLPLFPIDIERQKDGSWRVYARIMGLRLRLHHGLLLTIASVVSAVGAWSDRTDFPWKFLD